MVQMEIERSPPEVAAKKLWSFVRVIFYMVRRGLSKSKLMLQLHQMFDRCNLAGDAAAFGCRSIDVANSLVYPREYEFSCSNTPDHRVHSHRRKHFPKPRRYDDVLAVQKVFEILNSEKFDASPLITLPGFGKLSPLVRQLRITDSPFPMKDEGDTQIDKASEDFIKNFYRDLRQQRRMDYFESPYSDRYICSR